MTISSNRTSPDLGFPTREILLSIMAFLVAAGAIVFVWSKVRTHDRNRVEFETRIRAEQLVHSFETWIDSQIRLLEFLSAETVEPLSRSKARFTREISKFLQLYPNFQALNWVDPDWTIRWVVPLEGNEGALKQNLRDHPNPLVSSAIGEALESNQTKRTPVIDLLQGGKGFATYRPVHDASGELVGFLNGVFRIDRIAALCTDQPRLRETFHFMLLSSEGEEIFRHGEAEAILGSPFLHKATLTVVNRPWSLLIAPSPSHLRSLLNPTNNLLLALSLLLSAMIAALLGMHFRRSERIRLSEERFRNLVEQASDAFFVCDSKGRIREVNDQACRNLGYSREELLEFHITEVARNVSRETVEQNYAAIEVHKPLRKESTHFRKDGTSFPVEVSLGLLETGKARLYLAIARDITERKRAEEQQRELDLQIQQMQKLESLGVLAGGVAHDFNNILLAIIGNADLALDETRGAPELRAYIEEIQSAAGRAAELCRQMLAYSGRGRFLIDRIDVRDAIQKMSSILQTSVSKKALLSFHFSPDTPRIEADPGQFRQIMINLVTNASEALEDRTGTITVTAGSTQLSRAALNEMLLGEGLEEGEYVFIEVKDDGCGMDADVRDKLFDPFFSTKFTGRGLGMAAVLGIVRGHGGALRVDSEPGVGTSITVYLPAARESMVGGEIAEREDGPSEARETVLVVDDEEIVRTMASKMLTRMGYKTLVASEGWEAIRLYEKYGSEIGCVLLDLRMPGLDGEETFARLRQLDPEVRVLFSSGNSQIDLKNKKHEHDHYGFLPKPYQYSALEARIRSVLSSSKPQTSLDARVHHS